MEPRPVSASAVETVRIMTQAEANGLGNVHGGVIMREVDSVAGLAAARHAERPCVTAAIDELSFLQPVHVSDLLVVRAAVNFVGTRSLEVGVRVEAEPWDGGERRHTTTAYLVFVALDEEGRPAEVPPVQLETDDQRRRHEQARIRRDVRQERRTRMGSRHPQSSSDGGA